MELFPFALWPLLLLFTVYCPQPATSRPNDNFTDLESLLAFKAQVTDPNGILEANWTTNTSFCSWIGVSCSRRRQRVTVIRLRDLSLQGTISLHLGNLSFLSHLDLANNTLSGHIPEALGRLHRLTYLSLRLNSLSGPIPSTIFNMTSLVVMYVDTNNLSGSLPPNSSFMLPQLRNISLSDNSLTGDAMSIFARNQDLQVLSLSGNQFVGTIPAEIGSMSSLSYLYLGENQLSGTIPISLGNLTNLIALDLSWSSLIGVIPRELGNLPNLQYLHLGYNNLTGSIPATLSNNSMLSLFALSRNKLSGSVPFRIGDTLPQLQKFRLEENQLTGGLEFLASLSNCVDLQYIGIWENKLEGALPDSIGNLSTNLQYFYAYGNRIMGNIPAGLGNLSGLIMLSLHQNELTGAIPSSLRSLVSLQTLSLYFNRLSGSIPFELGLMKSLGALALHNNTLSGPIPESLANISTIQYLYLNNNLLSSRIPLSLCALENLLELDLSVNTLSGSIPLQVANFKSLDKLDLSMNRLSGNLPSALGKLQSVTYLDLSRNYFQSEIPETFGGLISVTYLNLSHNFLSGAIPNSIANLSYINVLDLSFNKLEGKVPNGRVFSNLSIPLLIGNSALCGAPQLHLAPCSVFVNNHSTRKLRSLRYVLPLAASGVILLTCLCLVYAFYWRRKVKTLADTDAAHLDGQSVISRHELVRATANFSEANLLGRGGFGYVYRGCLNNGLLVAVKVLNLEVEGASKSFDAECQVLRMVRHRNLLKIISVCSNLNFKALILQFMPKGSLEHWLYSDNCFLNLLQRLNIMVDVSLALEYLHHHHPHVVLHCDLKPTNVLLDDEMVAHVSDFGIAKLLLGDRSVASASMPGTIGYIAPEYTTTGTVSRMGDVYSFGILLLETFTGKRPVDAMFAGESNLREWVSKAHPTAIFNVVDYKLLIDHSNDDGSLQENETMHQCLKSIIELGLLCSSYSPKERISMENVTARLQKIRAEYLSNFSNLSK